MSLYTERSFSFLLTVRLVFEKRFRLKKLRMCLGTGQAPAGARGRERFEGMSGYIFLAAAIILETVATSALKSCEGFTRPGPSALSVAGYAGAFYLLSLSLKTIPVGAAYATWSGVGIVLICAIAFFMHGQKLDFAAVSGILFIIAGVFLLNVVSSGGGH